MRPGEERSSTQTKRVQFTSQAFTGRLEAEGMRISTMAGAGSLTRYLIERLWRTLKHEEIYLKDYANIKEAFGGLKDYFMPHNEERFHKALRVQNTTSGVS